MSLFVDTCVWSLAWRRATPDDGSAVRRLASALDEGELVFTTGLVLQELLQGFRGPRARRDILGRFSKLPFVVPDRSDHIAAADLRNLCRRKGVPVGTIDALIAQMCVAHGLSLLTTDADFERIAKHTELKLARPEVSTRSGVASPMQHEAAATQRLC